MKRKLRPKARLDTAPLESEPSPEEVVKRFLAVRECKRRRVVDWRPALDEEFSEWEDVRKRLKL